MKVNVILAALWTASALLASETLCLDFEHESEAYRLGQFGSMTSEAPLAGKQSLKGDTRESAETWNQFFAT